MNNELKPKDIPEDLIQLIRDNFENYPKVKEMRAQQEVAKRRFDLPTVKAIEDKLEHLFAVTLTNYLDAVNNEAEQLNTEAIGLTAKEKKEIDALHVTLHMSLDLIETAIMEINDILHIHDKTLQIEDFATVFELKKELKAKLEYFGKNYVFMSKDSWGDQCDKMFTMLRNKARKIVKEAQSDDKDQKTNKKAKKK